MRKNLQDTEISKQLILDAAEIEFAKYGYAGAKIDNIAKRTKMTKGAIFWHYKNKLELYKVVLKKSVKRMREIMKNVFATDETIMEQCKKGILNVQKEKAFEILIQLGKLDNEKKLSKIARAGIQKETVEMFGDLFEVMDKAKKQGKLRADSNVNDILLTMVIFMSGFTQLGTFSNMLEIDEAVDCEAATEILFKGLTYNQK
jgi:TetR/AcrR family acrAB operon transcriptional repressor